MKAIKTEPLQGIALLNFAHDTFRACLCSFAENYTAEQLLNIARASYLTEFDFLPDEWSERQVSEAALNGTVPQWIENDSGIEPVYK